MVAVRDGVAGTSTHTHTHTLTTIMGSRYTILKLKTDITGVLDVGYVFAVSPDYKTHQRPGHLHLVNIYN